jgi:hypothetical protein
MSTCLAESAVERMFAATRPAPFPHRWRAKNSMEAPENWNGSAQRRCGGMGTRVRGKRGDGRASMHVVVLALCLVPSTCSASSTFRLRCRATLITLNPRWMGEAAQKKLNPKPKCLKPLNFQLNPCCWMGAVARKN